MALTTFTGTNGSAWPSPWTGSAGNTIQNNRGQQVTPTTAWSDAAVQNNVNLGDGKVRATLNFPAVPGRSSRIDVRFNTSTGNGYRIIMPTDYNGFQMVKVAAWAETEIAADWSISWAANTDYIIDFEFIGSTLRAKRWVSGAAEPTAWNITATDTTFTTGDVRLVTVTSTAAAATATWDDVDVSAAAPVSSSTPATILNIGAGASQNHFSLQYAPDGGSAFVTKTQAELAAGFEDPIHFFDTASGWVEFSPRADGPTTSGSSFARDELREVNADGTNMKFNALVGEHIIQGRTNIVSAPAEDPDVVIAQLHDGDADRVAIRTQMLSSGVVLLGVRINGTLHATRFANPYTFNTEFDWKIRLINGTVEIYYNDMMTPLITSTALVQTTHADGWYWKVGAYNQFNPSSTGATGLTPAATSRSVVRHKNLSNVHVTSTTQTNPPNITNLWKPPQQVDSKVAANPELKPIADQPGAKWLNNQADADSLGSLVTQAAGKTMQLVVYAIPGRDGGMYSSGGFPDRASYINFVNTIKTQVGTAPCIVVVEPDALGLSHGFTDAAAKADRVENLRQAVNILATIPNAEVYIDASIWIPPTEQRDLLRSVDVHLTSGFAINVSNFYSQAECYTYGNAVVDALTAVGVFNKRYLVDSPRNGAGKLTTADTPMGDPWFNRTPTLEWCNPPGRRLGLNPGPVTGQPKCRATLWIKPPGESDGTFPTVAESSYFGDSAPVAGTFWVAYGRDLLGLSPQPAGTVPPTNTGTISDIRAGFDDGTFGSFTVSAINTNTSIVGGRARINLTTGYPNIDTAKSYKLTGGSVFGRFYMPTGVDATAANDASLMLLVTSQTAGSRLAVALLPKTNQIRFAFETNYWDNTNTTITYDATAHAWIRIRESGGTTYMETSPDGSTWTVRKSATTPTWATANSSVQLTGYASVNGGYGEVDSVNIAPAGAGTIVSPPSRVDSWQAVTLTASGTGTWSQISGPTQNLQVSGTSVSFTVTPSMTDQVIVLGYGGSTTSITITRSKHGIVNSTGTVQPIRLSRK